MSPHSAEIGYRLELANRIKRALEMSETLLPHAAELLARLVEGNALKRTERNKQEENRVFAALNKMAKAFNALFTAALQHGNATAAEKLLRRQQETDLLITNIGRTIIQLDNMKGATR